MSERKAPKKTASFRISPEVLVNLEKASREDGITTNMLVNQILGDYLCWERAAVKAGWILIKREVIEPMINRLGEKDIRALAVKAAKEVTKDTLLSMTGKYDLETWLDVTRLRSIKSGFYYKESRKDAVLSIIIKHGMGLNWSLFHKWYYGTMIRDLGKEATFDYTDKTLVMNVKR